MKNPFYNLLIVAGTLFAVTACAYGLMILEATHNGAQQQVETSPHPLFGWLRQYGDIAMIIELILMVSLTVAAITMDGYVERKADHAGSTSQ